jgi:hypothetical protein
MIYGRLCPDNVTEKGEKPECSIQKIVRNWKSFHLVQTHPQDKSKREAKTN